jgi:hypothetical protein
MRRSSVVLASNAHSVVVGGMSLDAGVTDPREQALLISKHREVNVVSESDGSTRRSDQWFCCAWGIRSTPLTLEWFCSESSQQESRARRYEDKDREALRAMIYRMNRLTQSLRSLSL